jgi:bacteriorhodopsin
VNVVWFLSGAANFGGFGNFMHGAMNGYHSFMGSYGSSNNFLAGISVVGLVCGVIVLIGAIMLKVDPHQSTLWAIVIIIFSVISFVGMGGYFIGAILGVVGGAFVLATRQINP